MKTIGVDANPVPPRLMFSLFNGGKALGSKVKFAKFYLIMQHELEDVAAGKDLLQIYYKVAAAIKKGVQSHKLGENGFKANQSGQYFNAHDSHNETFKLIEDAINQSGANAQSQCLTIGIQVDPDQFFIPEQGKYDVDGPKNLYDAKMLADWYVKLCNEHPLLAYIEDPIRVGDVDAWRLCQMTVKEKHPGVQLGVSKWFKSDLKNIKEWTQMVVPDEEDEEAAEKPQTPEEEDEEEQEQEVGEKADPNENKFIPDVIHLHRSQLFSSEDPASAIVNLGDIIVYQQALKAEERFEIIMEDAYFETGQVDIVDQAFAQQIGILNLQGIAKVERSCKVDRLQEILEHVHALQPEPQPEEEGHADQEAN